MFVCTFADYRHTLARMKMFIPTIYARILYNRSDKTKNKAHLDKSEGERNMASDKENERVRFMRD